MLINIFCVHNLVAKHLSMTSASIVKQSTNSKARFYSAVYCLEVKRDITCANSGATFMFCEQFNNHN